MTTEQVNGGEAVYRVLKAAGVRTVFGLLGGSMLELYDAIHKDRGISYVGARDERAAGHMADAYARITGEPGVVLGAQAGPGVVNLVTAVAEAHLAYAPLVVLAGAISRPDLGKDTFQEIDQVALFSPVCKRSVLVTDPGRLPAMLVDAMRLAMSGRRGPVVLHIPRDLFAAEIPAPAVGALSVARAGPPDGADLATIVEMLRTAARPVIVAGGGFKWSGGGAALAALAEGLDIPVVASTGHADVMRHGHPLFAGQGGPRGNAVASRLTRDADLLLVIGARLAFNSTFHSNDYVSASGRIVHIDIDPAAAGRYFPAALSIQADARASAEAILAAAKGVSPAAWAGWLARFREDRAALGAEREAEAANAAVPLHPRREAADRLAHYRTPSLITPLDFGLVGFGYAAALGAQAAAPERPVVAVIGDGGFGYTMAEVTTAVRHGLPVIAVVLDNGAWGAEKAYQQEFFGGRLLGAEIDTPPLDRFAELCGADGYAATAPGETAAALKQALGAKRPAVIHVKIDPAALSTLRKDLFKPAR
jgi:acetolactate synthase-1/2/3 large subunit/sulfoacetaldehyde acetyltransferase